VIVRSAFHAAKWSKNELDDAGVVILADALGVKIKKIEKIKGKK
jgi:hypothetical protein